MEHAWEDHAKDRVRPGLLLEVGAGSLETRGRDEGTTGVKLLILGGTIFLGRHMVEQALGRGYDVTLFNRGIHSADLFPQARGLQATVPVTCPFLRTDEGML